MLNMKKGFLLLFGSTLLLTGCSDFLSADSIPYIKDTTGIVIQTDSVTDEQYTGEVVKVESGQ